MYLFYLFCCNHCEDHVISISYVTSVWYVARINHEARCHYNTGQVIYFGNVPNRGRDISNLGRHEPVAMVNSAKYLVL